MRERDALRTARAFVRERYPDLADDYIEVCEEHLDDQRRKVWSFGVHPEEEREGGGAWVGYVHGDGSVEGLY